MRLIDVFALLPRPSTAGAYSVERGESRCRVGKSFDGHPAILIKLDLHDGAKLHRRLMNFAYHPPASVMLKREGEVQSAVLALVECCTNDRKLASYFFRIASEILIPEAASGKEARFEAAIDAVIKLFKALQRPAAGTVQGLWAELALIAFSAKPDVALSSWHSNPHVLHDFANGSARLEVKSSIRGLREHTFLLDQLRVADGIGQVVIASMLLREADDGASVFDVMETIGVRLAMPEARLRLETIVADSLGTSFDEVDGHRFDLDGARESLWFFRAHEIPTCLLPLPPEIRDVSFTVDLSTTPPMPLSTARTLSAQFEALLPLS